jgi:hypothetical protein
LWGNHIHRGKILEEKENEEILKTCTDIAELDSYYSIHEVEESQLAGHIAVF